MALHSSWSVQVVFPDRPYAVLAGGHSVREWCPCAYLMFPVQLAQFTHCRVKIVDPYICCMWSEKKRRMFTVVDEFRCVHSFYSGCTGQCYRLILFLTQSVPGLFFVFEFRFVIYINKNRFFSLLVSKRAFFFIVRLTTWRSRSGGSRGTRGSLYKIDGHTPLF